MKVIEVNNISKKYHLGSVAKDSLVDTVKSLFKRKEKKGEGTFWALKDISFDLHKGEVLGIIGKNGAGKSTLLKVLSRITEPTSGEIKLKGKVASLLEVGTGFHPELSGRENIFLNGAILGMQRKEIKAKFEEIVAFAGVEKFIDTPVKHYSSGMYVRLAFSVAAHLEPEILIIDEVLAVGDAEFQKKCLGKMKDVAREGRTVLFVSHNMAAVKSLCTRGVVLEDGKSVFEGTAVESVDYYLSQNQDVGSNISWKEEEAPGNSDIKLLNVKVLNMSKQSTLFIDDEIQIIYSFKSNVESSTLGTTLSLSNKDEEIVFSDGTLIFDNQDSVSGRYTVTASLPKKLLNSGKYNVSLIFGINKTYEVAKLENIVSFNVNLGKDIKHNKRMPGIIYTELKWNVENFNDA